MSTKVWKVAGMTMVMAGTTTLVYAQEGAGTGTGVHSGTNRPPREEMMKKFDKDGDGKLSETERAEMRKAMTGERKAPPAEGTQTPGQNTERPIREDMMKKFDKDGDGQLSEEEKTALRTAIGDRRGAQNGERPIREDMMKKFDKDGDGQLSEEEKTAMRAAIGDRKGGQNSERPGREEMMKKFDKDGDGQLSEEEKTAMRTEMEARKTTATPAPAAE